MSLELFFFRLAPLLLTFPTVSSTQLSNSFQLLFFSNNGANEPSSEIKSFSRGLLGRCALNCSPSVRISQPIQVEHRLIGKVFWCVKTARIGKTERVNVRAKGQRLIISTICLNLLGIEVFLWYGFEKGWCVWYLFKLGIFAILFWAKQQGKV